MEQLIWLVIALPLFGAGVLHFIGRRLGEPNAGYFATATVGAGFVIAFAAALPFVAGTGESSTVTVFEWLPALGVGATFRWDPLSAVMTLVVTGVGALIHLYAVGYMHGDDRFGRFFTYLNFFAASMLILVLADNFAVLFVGWELVGLSSYLLISFWFTRPSAAAAGKKAFVVNRIGDFGFMVALFLIFAEFGSFAYGPVFESAAGTLSAGAATAIGILLLVGAAGKSAQIPLYVWLPDAMEGPTPVSALIHAATMVTAGVYMVARTAAIYSLSPAALGVVATIGALTALWAASIAVAQTDIKRVLAYSTISQLGYMFLAVGSAAYVAGIFHLVTHAFFKALLFLGAGSVIHALAGRQDMHEMGGLRKVMPVTAGTMAIATLAIAGVPPLAGFWSKDEILAVTFNRGGWYLVLWLVGLVTAALTAFYMTRLYLLTFEGRARWGEGADPHESPRVMSIPLLVLAALAVVGGFINLPFAPTLEHFLEPSFELVSQTHLPEGITPWVLAVLSVAAAAGGIAAAWVLYTGPLEVRKAWLARLGRVWETVRRGYYVDEIYGRVLVLPGKALARWSAFFFDERVVDGLVNAVGVVVRRTGAALRPLQTGFVRSYGLGVLLGAAGLLLWFLTRGTL